MKNKNNEILVLGIIVFIGAVLRFLHFSTFSFTTEEFDAFINIKHKNFLFYWTKVFGQSSFSVRFPFILTGIACIPVIFFLAKHWFNSSTALFAAALFAFLRYPIYYSQLAGAYSFGMLFTLLTIYYWSKIIFTKSEEQKPAYLIKHFIGLILFALFAWHVSHHTFPIIAFALIIGLIYINRSLLKQYMLGIICIVLSCIWDSARIPRYISFRNVGNTNHLLIMEKDFYSQQLASIFSNEILLWSISLFLLLTILVKNKTLVITRYHLVTVLLFVIPVCIDYAFAVALNHPVENKSMLFALPFLFIFIGSFLPLKLKPSLSYSVILLLLGLTIYYSIEDQKYYRGGFKFIAEKTAGYDQSLGEHACLKVLDIKSPAYINYYLQEINHPSIYNIYNISRPQDIYILQTMLDSSHANYLLYGYVPSENRDETELLIRSKFPTIADKNIFYASGFMLYKKESNLLKKNIPVKEFISLGGKAFSVTSPAPITSSTDTVTQSEEMNDKKEFSTTFKSSIADLRIPDNSNCFFSAWIKTDSSIEGAKIIISFERNETELDWTGTDLSLFIKTPGIWQKVILARRLPKNVKPADTIKAYIWNPAKRNFSISSVDLKLFASD